MWLLASLLKHNLRFSSLRKQRSRVSSASQCKSHHPHPHPNFVSDKTQKGQWQQPSCLFFFFFITACSLSISDHWQLPKYTPLQSDSVPSPVWLLPGMFHSLLCLQGLRLKSPYLKPAPPLRKHSILLAWCRGVIIVFISARKLWSLRGHIPHTLWKKHLRIWKFLILLFLLQTFYLALKSTEYSYVNC